MPPNGSVRYDDEKLGFYKVAPHYYYPGWWEGGTLINGFVNLEKWNSLPKSYQSVLEQAAHYSNNWMMAKYDQANPAALRRLLAGGTKLHPFSPAIMEACWKAANELHDEIVEANASFKKVYDSMTAFRDDGYQWFQVAELSYDSFMVRQRADRCNREPKTHDPGAPLRGRFSRLLKRLAAGYLNVGGWSSGGRSICGISILILFGSIVDAAPL